MNKSRLIPWLFVAVALAVGAMLARGVGGDATITIPGQTVTIPATTFVVRTPGLNIRDFGAIPDDGIDDAPAFDAMLAALPIVDDAWNSWNRPANGEVCYLPSGCYDLSREPNWPAARKSVSFLSADHGARLKSAGNYAFTIPTGDKAVSFDGIIFDGGGVQIAAGARIAFTFRNCLFESTKDYAIRTLGNSVHEVTITDCMFSACNGAVYQSATCENWHLERCRAWRCGGAFGNVVLQSTGTTLAHCDFEAAPSGYTQAYVTVLNGPQTIEACRFGNESATGFQAAPVAIQIGLPAGIPNAPANPTRVRGVRIVGNHFQGSVAPGQPSDASGRNAVRLYVPIQDSDFSANIVDKLAGDVIDDAAVTEAIDTYANTLSGNKLAWQHTGGTITTGLGWLLPRPEAFDQSQASDPLTWVKLASVTIDAVPGASWRKVTTTKAGDFIRLMTGPLATDQITVDLDAVAGTFDRLRLVLVDDTAGNAVTSSNDVKRLDKTRRTYSAQSRWKAGNKLSVFVYPGDQAAVAGSVFVARPVVRFSNAVQ